MTNDIDSSNIDVHLPSSNGDDFDAEKQDVNPQSVENSQANKRFHHYYNTHNQLSE